jgi:hypothetical protein
MLLPEEWSFNMSKRSELKLRHRQDFQPRPSIKLRVRLGRGIVETPEDYAAALSEVARLWDAKPNTPAEEQLDKLATLIDNYEKQHLPKTGTDE